MAAQMFGPPAPMKKKPVVKQGPIQPAFPAEMYQMESPWSQLQVNPEAQTMKNYLPPVKEAPLAMPPTRLSESPFERPNVQMVGPTEDGELPLQIDPNYVQRPTIGTRMGESAKASLDSELKKFKRDQENTYLSGQEYNDYLDTVRNTPEIKAMQDAQAERDALGLEMLKSRGQQGVDLTPLMALTDAWTGSRFANSYKAPTGAADRSKQMLDFLDKTQDDKQKLAELILKAPQLLKSGTAMDQLTQALAEKQAYGIENRPPPGSGRAPRSNSIDEKFLIGKAEKLHSSFQEDKSQMNRLLDNLARGDIQGLTMSLGYVSRQLGGQKGVLTDRDIELTMPRTFGKTLAEAEAYFNNPGAKIDPAITKGLKELAAIAIKKSEQKYREQMGTFKNSVRNSSMAPLSGVLDPYEASINSPMVPAAAPKDKSAAKKQSDDIRNLLKEALK